MGFDMGSTRALKVLLEDFPDAMRAFLDGSDLVWIVECLRDGTIVHVNAATESGLGASLLGEDVKSVFRPGAHLPRIGPGQSVRWDGVLVTPGGAEWTLTGSWFGLPEHLVLVAPKASRAHFEAKGHGGMSGISDDMEGVYRSLQLQNLRLVEANRSMSRLATTDALTGVGNRRRLEESGPDLESAARKGDPVTLALLDLDHFKAINDTHGHSVGDEVLIEFAKCLSAHARATDTVVRWGGEEFVTVMPGMDEARAASRLAALTREVAKGRYSSKGIHVTVSSGVGAMGRGESLPDALHRIDAALYKAKSLGRNRVEHAESFDEQRRERVSKRTLASAVR